MVNYANLKSLNKKKYLEFEINLILPDDSPSSADYIQYFKLFSPNEGLDDQLLPIDSTNITINDISFDKNLFEISQTQGNSMIAVFSTKLESGYFLVITVSYWQKNKNAEAAIFDILSGSLVLE